MRSRHRESEMFPLIAQWETSGQTRADFCAAHGLSIGVFAYWRNKYLSSNAQKEDCPSSNFIGLSLGNSSPVSALSVTFDKYTLEFQQLPSVDYLKSLLS